MRRITVVSCEIFTINCSCAVIDSCDAMFYICSLSAYKCVHINSYQVPLLTHFPKNVFRPNRFTDFVAVSVAVKKQTSWYTNECSYEQISLSSPKGLSWQNLGHIQNIDIYGCFYSIKLRRRCYQQK